MNSTKIKQFKETGEKKYLQEFYEQDSYIQIHQKINAKGRRKFNLMLKLMNLQPGEKVLDVGCAQKHFKPYVESKRAIYVGLDLSKTFRPDLVGDAENMSPVKDNSYDWVIFADILEHIPHPEKALQEGRRVGKKIMAVVPNLYRLNSLTFLPSHPSDKHIIKLKPRQWLKMIHDAGLKIKEIRGFFYCVSVAFWPKMGIIDMFFRTRPFILLSDYIDQNFSKKKIWRFLGQELVVIAEK